MVKVHRAYRHKWWHPDQKITERDWQAMCNFADNGLSFKASAEHFGCSVMLVEAEIVCTEYHGHKTRRFLSRRKAEIDLGQTPKGHTWWESDHSDSLVLVKLYYPQYLPKKVSPEISAKEKQQTLAIDAEMYLEKRF